MDESREMVELDFGGGPRMFARDLKYPVLLGTVAFPVDGDIDWSQLEKLPNLITLEWSGPDRGFVAAAAARRVQYLYWSDVAGDVDLSGTSAIHVRLDGADLRSVRLPASIERLTLFDPPVPGLRVYAPEDGRGVELQLFWRTASPEQFRIPPSLSRIRKLWLWPDREFAVSTLTDLAELESLRITFEHAPGTLTDLSALQSLPALRRLELEGAFDWDPDALPDLPGLRELTLDTVRRTTAAALKTRFKGSPVKFRASGTRSDEWLAEHIDNPFRDWVEDSKAFGTAACKAYTKARTAIDAAPDSGEERSQALEAALRGLVADLNKIDARHDLIDTVNREHAWRVYLDLAKVANVDLDLAESWFDTDRRW